jgi:hypothetical protein
MRAKNFIWGFVGTALRAMKFSNYTFKKHKRDLAITPLSDTSMFVSTSVRPTLYEWNYDDNGERHSKRFFDPLYPKWTMRRSYHELPPYLTIDDTNNQFSRIALYTLINAFNRTGRITPKELLQVPPGDTHSAELQEAYRNRINGAMREVPVAFRRA